MPDGLLDISAALAPSPLFLSGGRVLLPGGGIVETDISIRDGVIAGVGCDAGRAKVLDVRGYLILPGIVDLHGDAFERQLMPRPGVSFNPALALIDTDRQLSANGITTAYHGLTWSWEPGLRGEAAAVAFVEALHAVRPHLQVDTKLHLRHETFNLFAEPRILEWLAQGRIDLLAFNDHMAHIAEKLDQPDRMALFAKRSGLTPEEFQDLFAKVMLRACEVEHSVARLAEAARANGVPMASHDDESPENRAWFHALGSRLCEFPIDEATAGFAIANQDAVILGAPNVLRGQSHCGRLQAADMTRRGLCSVLASDYYYPAMLQAPFKLAREGKLDFASAWALVSRGPADATGLADRGSIAEGQRADLLLVNDSTPDLPLIAATIAAGRMVHQTRNW